MAENEQEEEAAAAPELPLDPLLQLLEDQETMPHARLLEMQAEVPSSGKSARNVALEGAVISEGQLLDLVAGYQGSRVINLPATDIPQEVLHSVPASVARMYNCVPVEATNTS